MSAWQAVASGVRLRVRLTPRGGRDAIEGPERWSDGREVLKARVAAPPEDGKANAALVRLTAGALGVAASAVTLEAGHGARIKTLSIAGDPAVLTETLERLVRKESP